MKPSKFVFAARRCVAPVVLAAMLTASNSAFALASGSVVFDPTNWAENLRSALTSVKQYAQDVAQTKNLVMQLAWAAKNGDKIVGTYLFDGMDLQQREAAMEAVKLYDELKNLEGGLENLQSRYDQKVNASFNANRTVEQFMQASRDEAKRGVKASQQSINADLKALKRVEDTYEQVKVWQAKAQDQTGGHQVQFQLMNTQMSALVGQNAEVIAALTKASITGTVNFEDERVKTARAAMVVDAATKKSRAHLAGAIKSYGEQGKAPMNPDLFK